MQMMVTFIVIKVFNDGHVFLVLMVQLNSLKLSSSVQFYFFVTFYANWWVILSLDGGHFFII